MIFRKFTVTAISCIFAIFFSFSLFGSAFAEGENPETLTFSIIPIEETILELTVYKPAIDYLSKMIGKKVEFYMPTSYSPAVEALIGKCVHAAADLRVVGLASAL
jgi:ABC-type phosphate/phosphonate transport system substrate-binding protein